MQIAARQTVGARPVERIFRLVNRMPYRVVDAVEEAYGRRRKVFQLYAGALEEPLNRSVIIVPYVFYLVRSARLLQAPELLKLGLGLRAIRFWRRHEQY
jgi:hypothetical protein